MPQSTSLPPTRPSFATPAAHDPLKAAHNGHIACPQCHRTSSPDRKFCSTCGLSLWEPCIKCKVLSPLGERFCGSCGTNLISAHDDEEGKVETHLANARKAQAECRFLDALILLRAVEKCEIPRLHAKVEEAQRLVEEFKAERAVREAAAAEATKEAEQHFNAHRFAETIAHLERVPERMRSDFQKELIDTSRSRLSEIASLAADIKADLAAQRFLELAPKAQRLLTLEPGNESVKTLLAKLSRRLLESARERYAAQKYDEAQSFLNAMPESAHEDPNYVKLRQDVDEVVWLALAQRSMPLVDATLISISQRLVKLAPNDANVQRIHARLEQCLAAGKEREGRLLPPAWAKAPATTMFDCPVDAMYGFQRLAGPGKSSTALKDAPTSFSVAVGLALAAIGKGAVTVNLLPDQEESFFTRFVKLGDEAETIVSGWGIDVSVHGLKAVRLTLIPGAEGGTVELDKCVLIQPAANEPKPANENEVRLRKEKFVRSFVSEHSPDKSEPIAIGLAGAKTLGRFVELPPLPADRIADAVKYEAKHQIPFPLDQIYWGHQLLGDTSKETDATSRLVLLAAKRYHVEEHLSLFTSAGLKPRLILGDALALHNYLVHEHFVTVPKEARCDDPIAVVDVGSDCTNVVVSTPHDLWFRTIPQGSADINSLLIKELKLTAVQAEALKRQPSLARRLSRLYEVIEPWISTLVGEISRSLTAYANLNRGPAVQRIFGAGGGFQLPGLLRAMRQVK